MPFTGQITGDGRVWRDPNTGNSWTVPDGYDPDTSPYNPANAHRNTSEGWAQNLQTMLAPTPTLNAIPGVAEEATPFDDPALNAPVYGTRERPAPPPVAPNREVMPGMQPPAPQQDYPTTPPYMSPGVNDLPTRTTPGGMGRVIPVGSASLEGGFTPNPDYQPPTPENTRLNGVTPPQSNLNDPTLNGGVVPQAPPPPGPPPSWNPINPALGGFFPNAPVTQPPAPRGPAPSTFPTGTNTAGGGGYGRVPGAAAGPNNPDPFAELFGLGGLASIPDINLGDMPEMSGGWAPGFEDAYRTNTENTRQGIEDIYSGLQLPNMQGAQMDLGALPQLNPTTMGQSDSLKQLLSGQGFDPATMARLNAGATDTISRQATANRGSQRLALEQAGLGGSPVQTAIEGQINRQRGDATAQALNQNAIANADRGLENFRQGANMDFGREQNNMAAANTMALARASQMLTAMQQNVSNVQQANAMNFGAQNDRAMTSGNRQADTVQNAGSQFGTESIRNQQNANQQNAANRFNWNLNQANLDRGADTTNANLSQGRWNTGVNGLLGLAGMQNPGLYTQQGNSLSTQQNPTNLLGSVLSNIGQAATPVSA